MKKNLRRTDFWVGCTSIAFALGVAPMVGIAGELQASVLDKKGRPIPDAVVIAVPVIKPAGDTSPVADTITLDQINKEFTPYVLAVKAGTKINFPNKDDIRHHVYSFSPAKIFQLPLYTNNPGAPVLFDKPGVVALGCNIHDWMIAYIYISESPHFAKTGTNGKTILANLPAGDYFLKTWHPRMQGKEEETTRKMTVLRTGAVETTWEIGLAPDFRIRRLPIPGQSGYR